MQWRGKAVFPASPLLAAALVADKAKRCAEQKKMLSSSFVVVRFFLSAALRPAPPPSLPPDKRSASLLWRGCCRASASPRPAAFVAPCSLGAFLRPPETPKAVRLVAKLFNGGSRAPLVLRPCWSLARRYPLRCAKAQLVFAGSLLPPLPTFAVLVSAASP